MIGLLHRLSDFHFYSMKDEIKPLMFTHVGLNPIYRVMAFKLKTGNIAASLEVLQKKWSAVLPGAAF